MNLTSSLSKSRLKSSEELRNFGQIMALAFALLACLLVWQERHWGLWLVLPIAFFLIPSIYCPFFLGPVEKVWMRFAERLSLIMTNVILSLTFYLAITPLALLCRLLGKRFLQLKFEPESNSYWIEADRTGSAIRYKTPY